MSIREGCFARIPSSFPGPVVSRLEKAVRPLGKCPRLIPRNTSLLAEETRHSDRSPRDCELREAGSRGFRRHRSRLFGNFAIASKDSHAIGRHGEPRSPFPAAEFARDGRRQNKPGSRRIAIRSPCWPHSIFQPIAGRLDRRSWMPSRVEPKCRHMLDRATVKNSLMPTSRHQKQLMGVRDRMLDDDRKAHLVGNFRILINFQSQRHVCKNGASHL